MGSGIRPQDTKKNLQHRLPEMEQSEWYKGIYDFAPTLCLVVDPEGYIVDCNLVYVKTLGYTSKWDAIGRSFVECADSDSKVTLQRSFETWQKTGRIHNSEFKMRRADGSTFPALINATSIHDESGRTIACNAAILNVTELVNARNKLELAMNELIQKEAQLRELNEELKQVEKAKEEFVSLVNHELKNPLTPIIGFSDLLRKQTAVDRHLNDTQVSTIHMINNSAKEMKRLIDDIQSVYKLDLSLDFAFSETTMVELVDQVVVELGSILEDKRISLDRKILLGDGNDTLVTCDPMRIRQVLVNLVRNSVDFVPASTGRITITLEDRASIQTNPDRPSDILVSVTDNGPGIPAEKQSGLFRKFYQVSPTITRRHGGTGLGLTICKEIVERHGGRIWYDSTHKDGACFRFVLPREPTARQVRNSAA
jgi:PAS domain S-box-containing protein